MSTETLSKNCWRDAGGFGREKITKSYKKLDPFPCRFVLPLFIDLQSHFDPRSHLDQEPCDVLLVMKEKNGRLGQPE